MISVALRWLDDARNTGQKVSQSAESVAKRRKVKAHLWVTGSHLTPVTINTIIDMCCFGPFLCPKGSEAYPSKSKPGTSNQLFWSAEHNRCLRKYPSDHPWEVNWRKIRGQHDKGQQHREPLRGISASERVSERTSENLWKPLKTSKNLWQPLRTSENLLQQKFTSDRSAS